MPTYTYRCDSCGHQFDATQKFSDDPLTECPVCGAVIRRVIHPVGVVFKGSGWYITDSRAKPAESGASETKGDTKGDAGADAPTAEKPAKDAPAADKPAKDAPAKNATPAAAAKPAKAAD